MKSAILLSRVKTFNLRFRWHLYNASDTSIISPQTAAFDPSLIEDARSSPEFQQLDQIVSNFRPSFPPRFRSPVENDVLDPYLYTACTAAHLYVFLSRCILRCAPSLTHQLIPVFLSWLLSLLLVISAHILLHEPHAKPDGSNCPSARKTLLASRAIVNLMYTLTATNYDVTLLDLQAFVRIFF